MDTQRNTVYMQKCNQHYKEASLFCSACCHFLCTECIDIHIGSPSILHSCQVKAIINYINHKSAKEASNYKQFMEDFYHQTTALLKSYYDEIIQAYDSDSPLHKEIINIINQMPADSKCLLECVAKVQSPQENSKEAIYKYQKSVPHFIQLGKNIISSIKTAFLSNKLNIEADKYLNKIDSTESNTKKQTTSLGIVNKSSLCKIPVSTLYTETTTLFYAKEKETLEGKVEANDLITNCFKQQLQSYKECKSISIDTEDELFILDHFKLKYPTDYDEKILGCKIFSIKYAPMFNKWIGKECKYTLLYRASRDGYTSKAFHDACDDKGPTLVILLNNYGKVIGGYTPLSWDSATNFYKADKDLQTFLFSMCTNKKYALKDKIKAIYCHGDRGPSFGNGHNLRISNNCNIDNSCHAESMDESFETESYAQFLGRADGGEKFSVVDYEVLEVDS